MTLHNLISKSSHDKPLIHGYNNNNNNNNHFLFYFILFFSSARINSKSFPQLLK